jgi:hypothetical protein
MAVGRGLTIDIGSMFQRSKDAVRAKLLTGINGNNAYCVVYDFFSEVFFGVTIGGKNISLTWLNVLLIHILPRSAPGRIIHFDLGGETGKNSDVQAMFLKHG